MYWDRGCTWKSVPNRRNSMQTLCLEKRMTESRRRVKGLKMTKFGNMWVGVCYCNIQVLIDYVRIWSYLKNNGKPLKVLKQW